MKKFTKQYYLDFILSVIFISTLGVTSISNNTYSNLTLKLISVMFFSVMTVLRLKFIYKIKIKNVLQIFVTDLTSPFFKKLFAVFAIIFLILTATLTYSHNTAYGIWKIVNLVLVMFPFLLLILININHKSTKLYEIFVKVTEIFLVMGSLLIFLIEPFDYLGMEYKLSLERWSHVVFGRVSGFLFLFYLLHLLFLKEKVTIYNLIIIAVCGYSLYLTGLRAAIVGLIIIIPFVFVASFYFKRDIIRIAKLASVAVVIAVLGILFNNANEPYERLGKISSIVTTGQTDDGAVNARLDGWMVGLEMIKDSPFLGRGIGGYKADFKNYSIQKAIKYPHNLFIELAVEFGLLGWIGSLAIVYFIIYWGRRVFLKIMYERKKGRKAGWVKRRKGEEEKRRSGFTGNQFRRDRMGEWEIRLHWKSVSPRQDGRKGDPASSKNDFPPSFERQLRRTGAETGWVEGRNISLSLNSHFSILISMYFLVIFSLWLGMFSKDISSQSLLWVSLAVLSLQWAGKK